MKLSSTDIDRPIHAWALSALLVAMVLACYAPLWQAGFVGYDDSDYVVDNPHVVSGLSSSNVVWAFTASHAANWHPLTWLSHMADVQVFGLQARYHHVVNVVLHAVNAVLLFWLLRALTGCVIPSFLVAGLFAVHPVNVEAVAWIAQRKTTLSTLFALLTIAAYARYVRRGDRRYYLGSLALFGLSLLCKQTWVTMPLVLLLLDYWPLERPPLQASAEGPPSARWLLSGWWRLLPDKLPYLLLAIGVSVITVLAQQQALNSIESYPLSVRLGNVVIAYMGYLRLFAWPVHLAVFYPLYVDEITAARVTMALALLVPITIVCVWLGLRYRYLLVGWLWFWGTLVPVIGFVQVGVQSMADRYAYSALWGLFILVVWSARDLLSNRLTVRHANVALCVAASVVLATLAALTFQQAGAWRDTVTLFEDAVADTPRNWLAHSVLAEQYFNRKDYPRSLEHCRAAETNNPDQEDLDKVLSIEGLIAYETGSPEEAIRLLQNAIATAPRSMTPWVNLASIYIKTGQFERAAETLARAADNLNENHSKLARRSVYATWGYALAQQGEFSAAREKYEQAVAIDPDSASTRLDLARILLRENKLPEAAEQLQQALSAARRSTDAQAHVAAALVEVQLGDIAVVAHDRARGIQLYEQALVDLPDCAAAANNLAWVLATAPEPAQRDARRAVELALRAVALTADPDHAILGTLAATYAADGQMELAVATARRALELARKSVDPAAVTALEGQLHQYEQGKPYTEPQ